MSILIILSLSFDFLEADISKEDGDGEQGPKTVLIQNDKGKYIPATVTERHRSITNPIISFS